MALRHLPSGKRSANHTWMWACLLALNLSVWLQGLARLDHHGRAHGKRLRRELIRVPGRLTRHARTLTVHLHPDQWLGPLVDAYQILHHLPAATNQ